MAKKERLDIISQIESDRNTHLISYVTSTRPGMEVQMSFDAIRVIYNHLRLIGKTREETKVDLFLYSNGGDGTVPWRLVTLIREYASRFSVLVPFRAFSAATLAALGADEVIMHPMGMLGPIDPTVANLFNPIGPNGQQVGISVEDVTAYLALVKEDAGIHHEDELIQAFSNLADKVHPLALGNVKRSLSQSRMIARKLLGLHMDANKEDHSISEIIDNLTSKSYYHGHPINRQEAKDQIGIPTILPPSEAVEEAMWQLYLDYETESLLEYPFQPETEFLRYRPNMLPNDQDITPVTKAKVAFVESSKRTDVYSYEYQLFGQMQANHAVSVNVIGNKSEWSTE